jgi:hypothetical protein
MAIRNYGAGTLFAIPIGGGTPIKFGILQDVTVSIKRTSKKLFGRGSFPNAIGSGQGECMLKAKTGRIQASIIALLLATSAGTGNTAIAQDEIGAIPGSTAYTVTVASSATWVQDLGVKFATGGVELQQVASAPAAGQYSVAAGVYTFNVADKSKNVKISYAYTVSASGASMTVANPIQGVQTGFQVKLTNSFTDPATGLTSYSTLTILCMVSDELQLATKQADFVIPEFSAEAQEDANGNVFQWDFSEAS